MNYFDQIDPINDTFDQRYDNKPALQWFVEREFKKVKDMRD